MKTFNVFIAWYKIYNIVLAYQVIFLIKLSLMVEYKKETLKQQASVLDK